MEVSPYSAREEAWHTATHVLGIALSLAAIPWLAFEATRIGDLTRLVTGVAFALSATLLFLTSILYHSARDPEKRKRMRAFDHAAIFVLIAGTYTPFTFGLLPEPWGIGLFVLVWALAIAGVALKLGVGLQRPKLSVVMYLILGWVGIIGIKPLLAALDAGQTAWMIAGGVFYTAGVPFYLWKSRRYSHAIWHVFVLAGVVCHFVAVLSLVRR